MSERDSITPVAQQIPFDNTGKKFYAEDVDAAIEELRNRVIYSIDTVTSTLNGTHVMPENDEYIQVVEGSATGFSVQLPDATNLDFLGRRFEVINNSSESIIFKDGSGNALLTLIAGDVVVATLEDNSTAAGNWLFTLTSSAATGITSYSIGSDTNFSTTSSTDVLITGMTVTPVSGRYALFFNADIVVGSNNRLAEGVIYNDGSAITRTRRTVQGVSSNFRSQINLLSEIIVNGSQQVDVRVNINSGSLDINQRRLILIRLGS